MLIVWPGSVRGESPGEVPVQAPGEVPVQAPYAPRDFGWTSLSPSAAFGFGTGEDVGFMLHMWFGLAVHPYPRRISPFISAGSELNFVNAQGKDLSHSYFEVAPELRAGVSLLPPPPTWINQTFPTLSLYGIAAYRLENRLRGNAARLGVGLSLFAFARWQSDWWRGGLFGGGPPLIPWAVEVLWDFDQTAAWTFRVSYHF
jgi:hypothetical protein